MKFFFDCMAGTILTMLAIFMFTWVFSIVAHYMGAV